MQFKKMRRINFILALILGLFACNPKHGEKAITSNDSVNTTISNTEPDFITSKSVDGVSIGEKITDFVFVVRQCYTVKKEKMQLEGESYDIYNVYDKGQKIYSVSTRYCKTRAGSIVYI